MPDGKNFKDKANTSKAALAKPVATPALVKPPVAPVTPAAAKAPIAPVAPAVVKAPAAPAAKPEPMAKAEPVKPPLAQPAVEPVRAPSLETAAVIPPSIATPSIATIATKIEEGAKTMNQQTQEVINNSKLAAERVMGDVNERARTAFEKGNKMLEEATELNKGNVEALVASSKIAAKGLETLGQEAAEFGRKSFEQASTALKSFAEVKSATDLFKLQSEFAKNQFDSMIAESSKLSEAVIKLAGDVAEPISSRYSVAAERVKNLAAA